ncbi:hypothetical protein KOW79_020823 [Hemibagrus wyckioides]|uniref:Claudin n=1 Tax=Hemibagrus wyckioides TaxID=337641 RepID=A0A9D3N575_9TELE|nr:hypothetical protein KOW79_020823 [Hemibagrus wyckioides]
MSHERCGGHLPDLCPKGAMSAGLQMLGTALGVLGWLGTILACALPLWRVTAFIGNNIVTAQVVWEGLWMTCVVQSTGQMQCKVYDSMLALSSDLQASRAMLVIAPLVGLVAILASVAGGILSLIPPSWMANAVISNFYNPLVAQSQKRELGTAIFICWGASVLMVIGGGLLCSSWPGSRGRQTSQYKPASQTSRERTAYV